MNYLEIEIPEEESKIYLMEKEHDHHPDHHHHHTELKTMDGVFDSSCDPVHIKNENDLRKRKKIGFKLKQKL